MIEPPWQEPGAITLCRHAGTDGNRQPDGNQQDGGGHDNNDGRSDGDQIAPVGGLVSLNRYP
ncbi:hypothetical protein MCAG_05019 [Micromonospora sp. ATCC 39149]|nr:hypothetical protein MCAG_05019 [Micromonospora sp. ATCC 39149]